MRYVLDTSFLIGLEKIAAGHLMFINCPRDFLLRDYASLFPAQAVVLEILETVKPDQEIIGACQRLKQAGYKIALDDFVDSPAWAPLVALAAKPFAVLSVEVDWGTLLPRTHNSTCDSSVRGQRAR
jgi:EAL and modified HD-GYP domain-containing signal transduction protein